MPFSYQQLLHNVALRMSALAGTQKAQVEASYNTAVLSEANLKSADWPFGSLRDAVIMAIADFRWAVADTGSHPWRSWMSETISPLAYGTGLPAKVGNAAIIGVWGPVKDVATGIQLTEQPLEVIRRIRAETWRKYPLYYFKITDRLIEHTVAEVSVGCCVYDRDTELTGFDNNDPVTLPDVLELPITARAISLLTRDGAYVKQAAEYTAFADSALARIRAGFTTVTSKTMPGPTP